MDKDFYNYFHHVHKKYLLIQNPRGTISVLSLKNLPILKIQVIAFLILIEKFDSNSSDISTFNFKELKRKQYKMRNFY